MLFVVFCFGAPLFFALFAVRCVGMTRLFLLKADSWLWLVIALVIGLPITILSIFHHCVLGSDLTAPVLASVVHYLIAIGIIYYSYRLFHDPPAGKA